MKKEFNLSPNFSKNPRNKRDIKFIVIHYTGMQSEIESLRRLKNPKSEVSCHYLINRKGQIIHMVKDDRIAWHAGKSKWKNFSNLNSNSIGIELVNKGHEWGYQNFTNIQIKNLIKLCRNLKKKYKIKSQNFLGHSDIAPLRKVDPGQKFPWKQLSKFGLGVWYNSRILKKKENHEFIKKNSRKNFFKNLHKIGYRYFNVVKKTPRDKIIIKAFQQRFTPRKVDGLIDIKILQISRFLAKK